MKNLIIVVVALSIVGYLVHSFALAAGCSDIEPCGNGPIVSQAAMPWGMNGEISPVVAPGTVIVDPSGFKDVCPAFYRNIGCVDFTRTTYYKTKMVETANYLKNRGTLNQFPRFQFWVK